MNATVALVTIMMVALLIISATATQHVYTVRHKIDTMRGRHAR